MKKREWRTLLAAASVALGLFLGGGAALVSALAASGSDDCGTLVCSQPLLVTAPGMHQPGLRSLGNSDARVTIAVYTDYQCPHCVDLHDRVEPELIRRYVETGKARLEAHQVMYMGPESGRGAEASLCADDQGRFWEYRDLLYAAITNKGPGSLQGAALKELASQLDLNGPAFAACLDGGLHSGEVASETARAQAAGVQYVPTTLINGRKVEGALPFAHFARLVEEELVK